MKRTKTIRQMRKDAWAPIASDLRELTAIAVATLRKAKAHNRKVSALLAWLEGPACARQIRNLRLSGKWPPAPLPVGMLQD